MDRCVKCGYKLNKKQKLRCEDCIKFVDAELSGKISRPRRFYFKWNLKHKK